ncbi:MAG TPA: hypothetical protein VF755_15565, partial [Catenuloplanes sp.]
TAVPGASATPSATGSPEVSPSAGSATDEAAAALAASTTDLGSTPFKFTMTSGSTVSLTGAMDPPNRAGTSTLQITGGGSSLKVESLLIGSDLYAKLGGTNANANKWFHIDANRLPEGANIGIRPGQIDPAGTERFIKATSDVRQVEARGFAGTLDLNRAVGAAGISRAALDSYGPAAKSVPFRATVDEQGRLSTMTIDLPPLAGQPAQPLEIRYFDFGTAVAAQKPAAGEVVEASQDIYTLLGA